MLVTLWRKGLTKYATKIDSNNFRILATKFTFSSGNLLVVNSYFPCDPRVEKFDEEELITLLADIKTVIEKSDCASVLLAGDLNSDFSRQTHFTELVEDHLTELGLKIFWQNTGNRCDKSFDVDYTLHIQT